MERKYLIDGKFVKESEAKVSIFDLGFLRGYGVFDLTIARGKVAFMMNEHIDRFLNSAKILKLKVPYTKNQIIDFSKILLEKNNLRRSKIRWVLTGGESNDGYLSKKPTFAILIEPGKDFPIEYYTGGVKVISVNKKREIPEAKTTNYQIAYSNYPDMKKNRIHELLYAPGGIILEGATSNVFTVIKNKLVTPKDQILSGLTRKTVIGLAKNNGISIIERLISKRELYKADEVFITSVNRGVMPISEIDGIKIGSGNPGKITQKIIDLYYQFENQYYQNHD